MRRRSVIDQFIEVAATGIATPALPPAAEIISARCGSPLPDAYWALTLATKSYVNETASENRFAASQAMRLLETYGNWAFDWAVRRHAVEVRGTSDVKRVADASGAKWDVEGATRWRLAEFLVQGKGAANDRLLAGPAFLRLCGGIAAVFGPDSLISLCRELLDDIYERVSVVSYDFKTTLQEEAQGRFRALPTYLEVDTAGPDHAREFCWRVTVGPHSADGRGGSKKAAQQAAAAALLSHIGVKVSGPAARVSDAFAPNDDVRGPVALSVRAAESLLSHTFRRKGLLATALTHTSFINENRQRPLRGCFSYEILASLGSAAVWLLGVENYLTRSANGEQQTFDLSELMGVAVKMDLVAELPITVRLSQLLVTGKGQSGSITPRMKSEVMQAVLAAIILDGDDWSRGVSAASAITTPFLNGLRELRSDDMERLNPKTLLQENAQGLGWQLAYSPLSEEGPDHALVYKSQVFVTISGQRFAFDGVASSSKRGSESEAAKEVLAQIRESLTNNVGRHRPHLAHLGAAVLKSILTTLRLGVVGWRRVLATDTFEFSRLLLGDPAEAVVLLQRIHRVAEAGKMVGDLDALVNALALALTQHHDMGPVVARFAERWARVLDGTEPDRIDDTKMRAVVAEAQFLLAACSRLADDTKEEIPLHIALEMIGAEVTECDARVITNVRIADAMCAAVRFVSITRAPQITLTVADNSLVCRLPLSEIDGARLESATEVLRCLGISSIQSDDAVAFVTLATTPNDWVGGAAMKLRAGARPDLPLKYIAHHLHDMKNEITAAVMNATEAGRDRVNRFRHLAAAEDCLERGRATCREVVRAARQATEIEVTSFSLRGFLSEIVREAMVRSPSISFSTFLDGADVAFEADRRVLRNAIENLLKNALRAVENGGEIRVESVFDGPSNRVIIEVSNSGQLAPDRVLEALRAGGLPPSTAHAGVGFGLVSVVRSVELHGGSFRLFNRSGRTHALLELPSASTQSTEEQINHGSTITVG